MYILYKYVGSAWFLLTTLLLGQVILMENEPSKYGVFLWLVMGLSMIFYGVYCILNDY